MKKLLIKASGITSPRWRGYNSGVGRSTFMLLEALAKKKNIPFDIEVYVNGLSSIGFDFYNWPFKHSSFPIPERFGCKNTKLEPFFRSHFMKNDLLHIPHNIDTIAKNERYVVTLHDIIAYDNAIKYNNQIVIKQWRKMSTEAVGIMTCSNFSKSEIVNKLNIDSELVSVVYWGASTDKFYKENQEITKSRLLKLGIDFPYFVSVSCAHPRKNIRMLLKAYRQFIASNPEHRLVLVWGNVPSDILSEYAKEIKDKKLIFLDYISDDALRSLYTGATATMFPTRNEGFGFPILESFACGTPIMTCRNSCIPEVGKDVALYVGEDNIDEMTDIMKLFEYGAYDYNTFIKQSENLIKEFSWANTADHYIDFYAKYI